MSARVRYEGRVGTIRLAAGAAVGACVCWLLLATGMSAQQGGCQTGSPAYPACQTQTIQAVTQQASQQQGAPTLTPTPTRTTVPGVSAAQAAPNSAVILGGRGRVANIRGASYTVLWTTDAETTGQVLFGPSA